MHLGRCYYRVGSHKVNISLVGLKWLLVTGVVSTFLIFWSVSGLLLRIVMSIKKLYYKGLNSFVLRQLSSKINTTVFSMTIICLMLFVTICVLTSAFAIKNTMAENLKKMAPADIEFKVNMNLDLFAGKDEKYSRKQIENSHFNVVQRYEKKKVDLNKYLKESCEVKVYRSPKLTFAEFCGDIIQDVKEQYPFMLVNTGEDIVTISDYNRLMELFGG